MKPNTTVRYRVTGERPSHTHVPADVTIDDYGPAEDLYTALVRNGYSKVKVHRITTTIEDVTNAC